MKPVDINKNKIHFSRNDIEAVVCALPLVANSDMGNPEQNKLCTINCQKAADKLIAGLYSFTADELYVIDLAVNCALDIIGGTGNELVSVHDVDLEWKEDLSGYFFTYNKLRPRLDSLSDLVDHIEHRI